MIKINVTQEDIDKEGDNPIANAVKREFGKECSVDRRFIIFKGNEAHPFRLSAAAEQFIAYYYGGAFTENLKPFSFEIGATV